MKYKFSCHLVGYVAWLRKMSFTFEYKFYHKKIHVKLRSVMAKDRKSKKKPFRSKFDSIKYILNFKLKLSVKFLVLHTVTFLFLFRVRSFLQISLQVRKFHRNLRKLFDKHIWFRHLARWYDFPNLIHIVSFKLLSDYKPNGNERDFLCVWTLHVLYYKMQRFLTSIQTEWMRQLKLPRICETFNWFRFGLVALSTFFIRWTCVQLYFTRLICIRI